MIARRAPVLAMAIALAAMGGGIAAPARAGSLSVMPVRVDVAAGARFCSLTLGNDADRPVTVQVRGFAWSRDEGGADILTPDEGFVVNPPIATIAPHASRLVRCSLPAGAKADPGAGTEKQWRLIVDELPDPTQAQPGVVQTLLRISVPVFRGGETAAPQFTASVDGKGLRLSNAGTGHAKVIAVTLEGTGEGAGAPVTLDKTFYLLAGGAQVVPAERLPHGLATIRVRAEEGDFIVPLSMP
ncbi:molecular chaperone [Novosphingobium resinovorum]|uniref:fimbrial biogenesis chaperone n=1 Tax=Novosphingobium resinovorum TaxID=158500 RepID=UPI002ED1CC0C|nr:fimbria/pilus periplasmic chaperone [Novosphingobium resinovorum]